MFFMVIRDDPSRSELIRPGLAVRVDPVRLLYLPIEKFHSPDLFVTCLKPVVHVCHTSYN